MKNIETQIKRIAHHEAAHAVIRAHFFPEDQIKSISIVPEGETLGRVTYRRGKSDINYSSLQEIYGYMAATIIILLAGDAAEYVFEKKDRGAGVKRNFTIRYGDTCTALGKLIKFAEISYSISEEDSNAMEILFKLYLSTIKIVENLWEHIVVLAKKLLEAKTIQFKPGASLNDVPQGDRSCVGKELLNLSTWYQTWHKQEALHGI